MSQKHKLKLHLLRDMANLPTLTAKIKLEQVKRIWISHVSIFDDASLIWYMQLDFFLALFRFEVLLL